MHVSDFRYYKGPHNKLDQNNAKTRNVPQSNETETSSVVSETVQGLCHTEQVLDYWKTVVQLL